MSRTLDISDLLVTQNGLRDSKQIKQMTDFVKSDGMFDEDTLGSYAIRNGLRIAPLIEIARFEDGTLAIHNGHHRACSIYLGRKHHRLYVDEYFVKEWKYSDYTDIVLPYWITPFDVKTEVRVADLANWKKQVREFYKTDGEARTIEFINQNKSQFCEARTVIYTVGDLVTQLHLKELL